jgi:hypothetical protein
MSSKPASKESIGHLLARFVYLAVIIITALLGGLAALGAGTERRRGTGSSFCRRGRLRFAYDYSS